MQFLANHMVAWYKLLSGSGRSSSRQGEDLNMSYQNVIHFQENDLV